MFACHSRNLKLVQSVNMKVISEKIAVGFTWFASLNRHRERNKLSKKMKLGRIAMRTVVLAGIIALILGAGSYFSLNARQTPTGSAYADSSVRIDPSWNWRAVGTGHGEANCKPRRVSGWIFVDFHRPAGEPRDCFYSQ